MKLLEYQAKELLRRYGLPVPRGAVAATCEEIPAALETFGRERGVVKAQAYTGGRGKAGGIKVFGTKEEGLRLAGEILGMKLVTPQTGPAGVLVRSILFEELSDIASEVYVAVTLDRSRATPALILCPQGGMEIEEIAQASPDKILQLHPPYAGPVPPAMCEAARDFLGLPGGLAAEWEKCLNGLYQVYLERDCSLLEINPLIRNKDGGLGILDCKLTIDDNALFRQGEAGGDPNAELTPGEVEAKKYGLSYIQLDGDIGCLVNGAGLAMATMDIIQAYGGQPANFLDVGGSASEEAVAKAFAIITADSRVKVILVNIFGGIMRCDTIAGGIVAAVKKTGLQVPLVVRLSGTNAEEGKGVIAEAGLDITPAETLAEGAQKAVAALKRVPA